MKETRSMNAHKHIFCFMNGKVFEVLLGVQCRDSPVDTASVQ